MDGADSSSESEAEEDDESEEEKERRVRAPPKPLFDPITSHESNVTHNDMANLDNY